MGEGRIVIDGDVATFMRAVGSEMYSPEHLAVIVLAGPAMESHEDVRGGVTWRYQEFPRTGVTLQFKESLLVGALIRLHDGEGEQGYPSPELLVAGFSLPASRESVKTLFGEPSRSSQLMDLYLLDDRYLRFDFDAGQSTALTVTMPGVEATAASH